MAALVLICSKLASLALREINHPDHVVMFTWRTLTNLASRYGWKPIATAMLVAPEYADHPCRPLLRKCRANTAAAPIREPNPTRVERS